VVPLRQAGLVEVEVANGGRGVRIFLSFLKQFVEFFGEDFFLVLVVGKRFLEGIFAFAGLALKVLDGGGKVFKDFGFFFGFMKQDGSGGRIDAEGGIATGADHIDGGDRCRHRDSLSKTEEGVKIRAFTEYVLSTLA
jgi:hypothetical protein